MIDLLAAQLPGAKALYFIYFWLAAAILASIVSARKGYGEKPGLATGLILTPLALPLLGFLPSFVLVLTPIVPATLIWLLIPARSDSRWALQGPLGRKGGGKSLAELRAEADPAASAGGGGAADPKMGRT